MKPQRPLGKRAATVREKLHACCRLLVHMMSACSDAGAERGAAGTAQAAAQREWCGLVWPGIARSGKAWDSSDWRGTWTRREEHSLLVPWEGGKQPWRQYPSGNNAAQGQRAAGSVIII